LIVTYNSFVRFEAIYKLIIAFDPCSIGLKQQFLLVLTPKTLQAAYIYSAVIGKFVVQIKNCWGAVTRAKQKG
jgi:hypothetical protein